MRVADPRAAGVLAALAVGDQAAIERDDWELFRATGIAHLVSISGLHVTMFAWLAGLRSAALWRRSAARDAVAAGAHGRALGRARGGGCYARVAGWGVPAQRTVWMLATVTLLQPGRALALAAGAAGRCGGGDGDRSVGAAAAGLLVVVRGGRPVDGLGAGARPPRRPRAGSPRAGARGSRALWRRCATACARRWSRTLGLAPLSLVFFQQVSLVGFVANLVAIPLVTLVITPLALLGVASPPLWRAGAWVVQQLADGLALAGRAARRGVAGAGGAVWAQLAGLLAAVAAGAAVALAAAPAGVAAVAALVVAGAERPADGQFELLAVDVGQGTAVLVRTRTHLLVYDAGPQYSRDSDAGQRVLLPLLRARGEPRIDRLLLSHRDTDHVGGATALLKGVPVGEVISSLEPAHPLPALAPPPGALRGRPVLGVGRRALRGAAPAGRDYERTLKSNAMSCVLRVSAAHGTRC